MEPNKYFEELQKFIDKQVCVEFIAPNGEVKMTDGILRAMNFQFGTVIIMTPQEKILVKNYYRITRKREFTKNGNNGGKK